MKKRNVLLVTTILGAALLGLLLGAVGCSGLEKVSVEKFLTQAKQIPEVHSAKSTRYIGETEKAAYLECWDAVSTFGTRTRVMWVPLSELPADVVEQLKAGSHPWQTRQRP